MITFDKQIDTSLLPFEDQYKLEMAEIRKWLDDNDFIINKHTLGEYSDSDSKWVAYLDNRNTKLARYNELEQFLLGKQVEVE